MTHLSILKSRDKRLFAEEIHDGILRIHLSCALSRWLKADPTCYLIDGILIDTGFAHIRDLMVRFLADYEIKAICCTHNHEDHAGNCGALSQMHDCPVYLANPDKLWEEGVRKLAPYRRLWWGPLERYEPLDMPEVINVGGRPLRAIRTPGHSQTHVAFFEESSRFLFAGDMYVSGGVTAILWSEDPYASIRSLREVAALAPIKLFNGHSLVLDNAKQLLNEKADRMQEAVNLVVMMHRQGSSIQQILRRVFPHGQKKDLLFAAITGRQFSRANFVRACIVHLPENSI
ncbi:MAG: MBL fold metallo-hydrolase [Pseudomonadota bacterium]